MSDLIDREEAYTELYHEFETVTIPDEDDDYWLLHTGIREGIGKAMDLIKDMPTIDTVHVVRCKDCKHYTYLSQDGVCKRPGIFSTCLFTETDFCSFAERREE